MKDSLRHEDRTARNVSSRLLTQALDERTQAAQQIGEAEIYHP